MKKNRLLYEKQFEHDACGVGFVADINGKRANKILQKVSYNLSKMKSDKINIYYWGADKFTIILKDCNNIQEIKKLS